MPSKQTKTRGKAKLNDFGKAVYHHMIDQDKTMDQVSKPTGLSPSSFRNTLVGYGKPPRNWIGNKKLSNFLRRAAAEAHYDAIVADYKAVLAVTGRPIDGDVSDEVGHDVASKPDGHRSGKHEHSPDETNSKGQQPSA